MHLRMKIGLCILMGFGVVAGACAIIRTAMLHVLDDTASISYGVLPAMVSAMTEQWITFIVACIPPSRPIIKFFVHKVRDVTHMTKTMIRPSGSEKLDSHMPTPPEAAVMKPYKGQSMFSQAYHDSVRDFGGKQRSVAGRYGNDYSDIGTLVRAGTRGIFMTTDVVVEYEDDEPRDRRANSNDTEATMFD